MSTYKIIKIVLVIFVIGSWILYFIKQKYFGKIKINIDNLNLNAESNVTGNFNLIPKRDFHIDRIVLRTVGYFQKNQYEKEVFFIREQNIISDLSLKKAEEFNKNFSIKLLEEKDYEHLSEKAKKYLDNSNNKGGLISNISNFFGGPKWQLQLFIYGKGREFLTAKILKVK